VREAAQGWYPCVSKGERASMALFFGGRDGVRVAFFMRKLCPVLILRLDGTHISGIFAFLTETKLVEIERQRQSRYLSLRIFFEMNKRVKSVWLGGVAAVFLIINKKCSSVYTKS
jgi:hypothetical protein